jgi:hypothetical protein
MLQINFNAYFRMIGLIEIKHYFRGIIKGKIP